MILAESRQLAFHPFLQFALEQMRYVRSEWPECRAEKTHARAVARERPALH